MKTLNQHYKIGKNADFRKISKLFELIYNTVLTMKKTFTRYFLVYDLLVSFNNSTRHSKGSYKEIVKKLQLI